MPVSRTRSHKIGTGTLDKTAIDALTAIRSWTKVTDQGKVPWLAPTFESTIPTRSLVSVFADGSVKEHGYLTFDWRISFWTFGMLDYFLDTFLTTASVRVEYKLCSVLLYDDINVAQYIAGTTVYRPHLRNSYRTGPQFGELIPRQPGGFEVILHFAGGTDIT